MPTRKPFILFCTALLSTASILACSVSAQDKAPAVQTPAPRTKPHPDVQALLDKADALSKAYKWPDALKVYEDALTKARTLQDRAGEAQALTNIGSVYAQTGQPQKALEYYEQELPLHKAVGNRAGEANMLGNIGSVYAQTGQPQKALEYYKQALPLHKAVGNKPFEANTLGNIGVVYRNIGQPQKALEYLEQALALHKAVGNKVHEATTLMIIGAVYADLGQPQKALEYYEQALPIYKAVGNKPFEADTLGNIGAVYADLGQPQKALEYYEQALPLHKAVGNRAGEANTLGNIGVVYRNISQPQKALEYYEQALPLHKAVGNRAGEANTLNNMASAEQDLHRPQQALTHARQAVSLLEQLRADLGGYSEAKTTFLAAHLNIYYHALQLLLQQHQTADAFTLAQQTKARTLLDLLASGKVDLSAALTPEERQQEQELRQQADNLNQQMMKEGVENQVGAKQRFAVLQGELRQTEQRLQTFTDTLYARHPDLANKRAARTATLADLTRLVPEDTALLDYIQVSNTELALFVVTSKAGKAQAQAYTLPVKADVLAKQCAAFHAACADPRQEWKPLSRQLYRLLMQQAQPQLVGKTRLIVCPDGPLWDVAFGALTDARGRPLLARFTLSMAYSATGAQTAFAAPSHKSAASGSVLCFANPDFGGGKRFGDLDGLPGQRPFDLPSRPFDMPSRPFDMPSRPLSAPSRQMQTLVERGGIRALPGTQREAEAIKRDFPDARIYTGKAAQEATFKQVASGYRYLHFATHGFFNDASPLLSSLVLAQPSEGSKEDGFLTARELFGMKLNAELAVLSACNTGRGERRSGEGIVGLTWALFAAGCPSSIVSGWAVDDAATATLMGDFYGGLKEGKGKAVSLREAALKLRGDGAHSHPYYWAAFLLVGNPR